ncbi:OLC1v1012053C1 [Oldenlandia corymbosa var. corymbosa]|uniref:OLC1v1012053C1 n=1 Tax=Oldenlandia corymbosa var. corymbosa TaxID=529605 RepID=A0AAV1DY37_OLDCO|nr:OLC1v1012053C1 [Oldenlandia corymbosa var. corymbosa]
METEYHNSVNFASVGVITLSSLFLVLFIYQSQYHHKRRKINHRLPAGRTGFPIIGENMDLASSGPEVFIRDRMKKYDPATATATAGSSSSSSGVVFRTSLMGEKNMAVFCGAEGNKFVFSKDFKDINPWWPAAFGAPLGFPLPKGWTATDSVKITRIFVHEFLRPETLKTWIPIMDSMSRKHIQTEWAPYEDIKVYPVSKKMVFSLVCRIFLGMKDEEGEDIDRINVDTLKRYFDLAVTFMFSFPIDFPGTAYNKATRAGKVVKEGVLKMVIQKIQQGHQVDDDEQQSVDLLTHILFRSKNYDRSCLRLEDICNVLMATLLPAYDDITAGVTFVLKFLAQLPHIYNQVYSECMDIARSKVEDELINWDDIHKMQYCWNVVRESMRLIPPSAGAFGEVTSDLSFEGFTVPKGWKTFWSGYSTHKDSKYFPNPEDFDPSRFEGNGPAPYAYVPFGGGPRICPGRDYARVHILVFLYNVVTRFKLELLDPNEKVMYHMTPFPEHGLPVRLIPHVNRGTTVASLIQCFDWETGDGETLELCEGLGQPVYMAQPLLANAPDIMVDNIYFRRSEKKSRSEEEEVSKLVLSANHPVTPPADAQGSLPPVTIANLRSYNSKREWQPLPKVPKKIKEFANDLEKLERYPKILGYGVVQHFVPVMPIEGLEADKILDVPFEEKEARQTKETIPPITENEAPSEKETSEKESGPSTRPNHVEKGKNPVEGNVTIFFPKIPTGGPAVVVHTFDNPPTIECPVLEEFAANLTEADGLKLMSAVMKNHAKRSRDLRRELTEAQAKRDQVVIEKRALEERNQQLQAKEVELALVQTQLGELKQKFQEYYNLHISKEDLNKWCTAFCWRMLSSGGMTFAVEEINTASMAYRGHAVAIEGLKRLKSKKPIKSATLWEPLCEALSKMGSLENITSFLEDVAPIFTRGPGEEMAIPKVVDEDFRIDLEEDENETAEEDDTGNSGPKDQDPPTVGDTRGAEEGNPSIEESTEDQPGNDSHSQTADSLILEANINEEMAILRKENVQLKCRERIAVSLWFLEKFHILSLVEKQIQIRTERFIAAIEMLKKRTKEAEFYSRQSAVQQNILVDREILLTILKGLDEHEKARERTAAEEFLLRLDEQDWEIVDLKDKLNQCIDHLRTLGFSGVIKSSRFNPKGEDLSI